VKAPDANPISLFGGPISGSIVTQMDDRPEPSNQQENAQVSVMHFPPGFSDDEDVDGELDRTYTGSRSKSFLKQKALKSPRGMKSPLRHVSDDDAEQSPKSKKPRKSLFKSSSVVASSDEADDEDTEPQQKNTKSVRNRMSSLNLTQDYDVDVGSVIGNGNTSSSKPSNFGLSFGNASEMEDEVSQCGSLIISEQNNDFINSMDLPRFDEDHRWNYNLRENIDREVKSTWMDHDQTGNYDPTEENRKKMAELNKAKARKKKAKKGLAPKKKKEKVKKFIVRLAFRAIGNVLQVTDEQDNWPEDWSEMDSEEEAEERERDQRRKLFVQKPKFKPQDPILDPKGELHDLTGHPVARGCVDCRSIGIPCSMVMNGKWPCTYCVNEGYFCSPIITPKVKGKCQRCEHLGEDIICSFEDREQEQGDMCELCFDAECESCLAGPASGSNDRIDLDQLLYGPDREWVTCTNCRQHKKRCSLKRKSDKPPCKGCKRNGIGCTFTMVSKTDPPKNGKKFVPPSTKAPNGNKDVKGLCGPTVAGSGLFTAEDLADLEDSDEDIVKKNYFREATPEIEMSDAQGRTGIVTKIDTCFAHPIEYDILGHSTQDCSFCEMPLFGVVGHFERTVHVLKWHNNLGYGELAAGYQEEYGQTVICSACIMTRVQIINCAYPGHSVQPIITDTNLANDQDEAMTALIEAQPGSDEYFYQLQRWCSMCFSLASFKCCNEQAALTDGEVIEGCGLRLCGACHTRFREEFNLDSSAMAAALELEPKWKNEEDANKHANPARADVGFLVKAGHLMNNVNLAMGDEFEGGDNGEGGDD
jgi:hypothetical protein